MGRVGPRPGTPPSESDSHPADAHTSVITRRFWTCRPASSAVLTALPRTQPQVPGIAHAWTGYRPPVNGRPACRHPHDTTGYGASERRAGSSPPFIRLLSPSPSPVGAETLSPLYDLGIFFDQAAEPVPAQNAHTGHFNRWMCGPGVARPGGDRLFVIMGKLSANKAPRSAAERGRRTSTYASPHEGVESQSERRNSGRSAPCQGKSDYRNHPALARGLQDYLRGRNAHACHPDVLAAQRGGRGPHPQRTRATPGPPGI
jgi:hypothetical protein